MITIRMSITISSGRRTRRSRRRRQRQRSRNTAMFSSHPRRNSTRDKEAQPSFPNIPEEIILQILQRLPLKSLSRFACVSKNWLSLISDISATKRGRDMLLLVSDFDLVLHSIDPEKSHEEIVYTYRSNIRRSICGSCNGLVVVIMDPDFFLWNPLTGYSKKVLSYGNLYDHRISGLCYDSSTDDYNIVMVLVKHVGAPGGYGYESVLVGSLKSKSWTHVDCSSYIISSFDLGPIVNERLHWKVCEKKKSEYYQIVYFNPQMRTFAKVPMPQPKHSVDGDFIYGLGVMDGCLCMSRLDNQTDGERYHVEVLAMKEYGMEKSWTIMFVVSNFWPIGFTKNGKALALKVAPHQERMGIWVISVYNPMDNSIRDIPVPTPLSTFDYGVYALTYEESLVKPTDYNWEDEELRGKATYVEYFLGGACRKMERHTYWFEQPPEEQPMSTYWGHGLLNRGYGW